MGLLPRWRRIGKSAKRAADPSGPEEPMARAEALVDEVHVLEDRLLAQMTAHWAEVEAWSACGLAALRDGDHKEARMAFAKSYDAERAAEELETELIRLRRGGPPRPEELAAIDLGILSLLHEGRALMGEIRALTGNLE